MCHDIVHRTARPDRSPDVIHVEARGGTETSCPACHEPYSYNGEQQPQRQQNSPGNTGNRQSAGTLPGRLGRTQKAERCPDT